MAVMTCVVCRCCVVPPYPPRQHCNIELVGCLRTWPCFWQYSTLNTTLSLALTRGHTDYTETLVQGRRSVGNLTVSSGMGQFSRVCAQGWGAPS